MPHPCLRSAGQITRKGVALDWAEDGQIMTELTSVQDRTGSEPWHCSPPTCRTWQSISPDLKQFNIHNQQTGFV